MTVHFDYSWSLVSFIRSSTEEAGGLMAMGSGNGSGRGRGTSAGRFEPTRGSSGLSIRDLGAALIGVGLE